MRVQEPKLHKPEAQQKGETEGIKMDRENYHKAVEKEARAQAIDPKTACRRLTFVNRENSNSESMNSDSEVSIRPKERKPKSSLPRKHRRCEASTPEVVSEDKEDVEINAHIKSPKASAWSVVD